MPEHTQYETGARHPVEIKPPGDRKPAEGTADKAPSPHSKKAADGKTHTPEAGASLPDDPSARLQSQGKAR